MTSTSRRVVATVTSSADWLSASRPLGTHSSGRTGSNTPLASVSAKTAACQRSLGSGSAVAPRACHVDVAVCFCDDWLWCQAWMTHTPVEPITRCSRLVGHPGRVDVVQDQVAPLLQWL